MDRARLHKKSLLAIRGGFATEPLISFDGENEYGKTKSTQNSV
jgi:hypothetical protein